jgi:hypothetical protein
LDVLPRFGTTPVIAADSINAATSHRKTQITQPKILRPFASTFETMTSTKKLIVSSIAVGMRRIMRPPFFGYELYVRTLKYYTLKLNFCPFLSAIDKLFYLFYSQAVAIAYILHKAL